jgi:hypothetical protein
MSKHKGRGYDEELVARQYTPPMPGLYNKKIEKMVPEKKKKKKRTTVKANAYAAELKAKANAAKAEANKAEANAREKANANKANANKALTQTLKRSKPAPRVRVRHITEPLDLDLNGQIANKVEEKANANKTKRKYMGPTPRDMFRLKLNLNEVDNPKRQITFNNVRNTSVKVKRVQPKLVPRGAKPKGTSLNGLTLMNRKEANKKVKGTPLNTFLNLSVLRQKQNKNKNKNTKRMKFKDRKESALARIMETVNLSKAKHELEKMAPNSPGTKLAKELKKEEEKYNKEWKKEEEDRIFDEKMPTFHQLATENGINLDVAHNLHEMAERANRTSVNLNPPKEENTLPYFPGLSEKPKPKPGPKPRPRGKAVPRGSKKNAQK